MSDLVRQWDLTFECKLCQQVVEVTYLPKASKDAPFPLNWKRINSGWTCPRHGSWLKFADLTKP